MTGSRLQTTSLWLEMKSMRTIWTEGRGVTSKEKFSVFLHLNTLNIWDNEKINSDKKSRTVSL